VESERIKTGSVLSGLLAIGSSEDQLGGKKNENENHR
jgi:hypothetical protein